jgi:NAD-dependent SIR2 family protein deacetylase
MRLIELSEFLADPEARRECWCRKIEGYPQMRDAEASEGHQALARLQQAGRMQTLTTQNLVTLN